MRNFYVVSFILVTTISSFAQAEAQENAFPDLDLVYEPLPVRHFDPETDPRFSDPELALKMRIIYKEEPPSAKKPLRLNQRANHFCIIGYEWQDGRRQVPVFWRELGVVSWWRGRLNDQSADSEGGVNSIAIFSRHTDVEKDTVSTETDLWGSTYLMIRSGVIAVIRDCALHGRWIVIDPFEIPPACDSNIGECDEPGVHPLSKRVKVK
jgi:hypothetical protein